jgi:hypothetical protein
MRINRISQVKYLLIFQTLTFKQLWIVEPVVEVFLPHNHYRDCRKLRSRNVKKIYKNPASSPFTISWA